MKDKGDKFIEEISAVCAGLDGLVERYFAVKEEGNRECNFGYDRDNFLCWKLAYTFRLMFLKELREYDATAKLGRKYREKGMRG